MNNWRRDFERFCYRHRDQGIPNLMLYVMVGTAIMYIFEMIDPSHLLYYALRFDPQAILHGQVWRLITYIFIPGSGSLLSFVLFLFFYYYVGRMLESQWGVFKFNLFYLCGVLLTDLGALLLGAYVTVSDINLSLILAFATMFPESRVYLFFIIPLKMKYLAWFYFALTAFEVLTAGFPYNLFPIIALLNYFLFFGSSILGVLPDFMQPRRNTRATFYQSAQRHQTRSNWFQSQKQNPSHSNNVVPFRHKCTVCGRTDTDYPDLEFRYCSRCSGYHCYCIDHINNHAHIIDEEK